MSHFKQPQPEGVSIMLSMAKTLARLNVIEDPIRVAILIKWRDTPGIHEVLYKEVKDE